jgi:hypothetical protein
MTQEVNLLDCDCEPTDEQLEALMAGVVEKARARAEAGNQALRATMAQEMDEVRERYGLASQKTGRALP